MNINEKRHVGRRWSQRSHFGVVSWQMSIDWLMNINEVTSIGMLSERLD